MKAESTYNKGRTAKVGMSYEMYGYVTIPIPDDFDADDEYALREYLDEHLDETELPDNAEYVFGSAQFDYEFCEIKEPPKKCES